MYIASASTTIKVHDFPSGSLIHNYHPGNKAEGPIQSISWNKDGNWLVVVPYSGLTEIVAVKDHLKLMKTIQDVKEPTCASFQHTTKKCVAVGTKSGKVLIYDIKSRNAKKQFQKASSPITHVEFTATDTHCIAASKNGEVFVNSNITNSPPSIFQIPKSNSVNCLRTNRIKRNLILGGSNEGVVAVWDTNINKCKFQHNAHKAPVNAVSFSPNHVDLIVSTGSDRECFFYDICDNKCIATVSVENSITAIDFSPDGTYFVMAAQNGKIHIYDARNIQKPVNSFQAHNSTIKHITFQNILETLNSNSVSNVSVEATPLQASEVVQTSDFFGLFMPTTNETSAVKESPVSMEAGDSFLVALGIERNSTLDSPREENKIASRFSRLPTVIPENSPIVENKQFSSTPKEPTSQLEPKTVFFSLNNNQINNNNDNQTIYESSKELPVRRIDNSAIRELIKEELQGVVEEIKSLVQYEGMHTTQQLKSSLLDIQMAIVRESLKMENYTNEIKHLLGHSEQSLGTSNLIEENEQLKRRVVYLEEQLKNLNPARTDSST